MLEDFKEKTDEEIIFLSLKNPENFGEIIDRYEEKLKRYIRRISALAKDEEDDLIQDVFLSIYENINSFEKNENFSAGIYRITHNKVIDFGRKNKKMEGQISVDENLGFVESIFNKNDVEEEVENLENKELLRKLFSTLDLKYREVFTLRYYEEKTYDEISEILKIPKTSVSTLLSRGKKKLIKEYNQIIKNNK